VDLWQRVGGLKVLEHSDGPAGIVLWNLMLRPEGDDMRYQEAVFEMKG
jgi:hypothetical protein